MAKQKWKGAPLLAPLPAVLVSCGSLAKPNLLTIAWTGILSSDPPRTYISVRPERYSHALIRESGQFVINLVPSRLVRAADFCGVRSGRALDKAAATGLSYAPALELTDCPALAQSPVCLECRVAEVLPMGSHDVFVADIVAVAVEPWALDERGKLRLDKCALASYAHGEYFAAGKKLGYMGFSVRKKRTSSGYGGK